jgi:hypothetical protein
MSLTALFFAHGLGQWQFGIRVLSKGLMATAEGGRTSREHYVRPAETARQAWRSGIAKTLLAVRNPFG